MAVNVRNFLTTDYAMIKEWHGETANASAAPSLDLLPPDTTFVLEDDGTPVFVATMFLTNCKAFSIVTNLIGNPKCRGPRRIFLLPQLAEFFERFAAAAGYGQIIVFSGVDKLITKYEALGYAPMALSQTILKKEI